VEAEDGDVKGRGICACPIWCSALCPAEAFIYVELQVNFLHANGPVFSRQLSVAGWLTSYHRHRVSKLESSPLRGTVFLTIL
jgi:hypothetical protein